MKNNWKRFVALFLALAVVLASGVIATTTFYATDEDPAATMDDTTQPEGSETETEDSEAAETLNVGEGDGTEQPVPEEETTEPVVEEEAPADAGPAEETFTFKVELVEISFENGEGYDDFVRVQGGTLDQTRTMRTDGTFVEGPIETPVVPGYYAYDDGFVDKVDIGGDAVREFFNPVEIPEELRGSQIGSPDEDSDEDLIDLSAGMYQQERISRFTSRHNGDTVDRDMVYRIYMVKVSEMIPDYEEEDTDVTEEKVEKTFNVTFRFWDNEGKSIQEDKTYPLTESGSIKTETEDGVVANKIDGYYIMDIAIERENESGKTKAYGEESTLLVNYFSDNPYYADDEADVYGIRVVKEKDSDELVPITHDYIVDVIYYPFSELEEEEEDPAEKTHTITFRYFNDGETEPFATSEPYTLKADGTIDVEGEAVKTIEKEEYYITNLYINRELSGAEGEKSKINVAYETKDDKYTKANVYGITFDEITHDYVIDVVYTPYPEPETEPEPEPEPEKKTFNVTVNYWLESGEGAVLRDYVVVPLLENGYVDPDEDGEIPFVEDGKLFNAIISPKIEGYFPFDYGVRKADKDQDDSLDARFGSDWAPTYEGMTYDMEKDMLIAPKDFEPKSVAVLGISEAPTTNYIINIYYAPYGFADEVITDDPENPNPEDPEVPEVPEVPEEETPNDDVIITEETTENDNVVPGTPTTPRTPGTPVNTAEVPALPALPTVTPVNGPVAVAEVTPMQIVDDGNGGVSLTEVEDLETALANQDLGHICNILYFLLLLTTAIVLFNYYRSAKKHNKRIFELRKELGEDDPYRNNK